ncbi:Retrovirus-related Pol polyprotein from transposon RE2 [Vitis vinifera]|uniref:Retrovirus-related Pol polyprotein from transposon RE2 n=1 Tax=Vitis vinifera TaxID=29760 RepID=A0A438JFH5_VITVI|nr:Retrovirus-related Pol polyprotein from transposon RE2 [Vitis vinifera]
MVLPSFEQQFSDLHPVSSCFQPDSISCSTSITFSTLLFSSVCTLNRYGFPSSSPGNSISALTVALSNVDIPTCYSHAAKHDCWRQAMQEEIAALEANHTWDIEPCPPTIVPLGCKWVYSVKEYGVNYEETFAPVAKMTIVRMILALAASSDWPLHQMDPFAKVVQSMQGKNNGEEENRVKKTEESSCSFLSHFWSTSRSLFSTCYIPFQSSGSQESNTSNRVRFGAEMRKIWPLEDNCIS